MDLGKVGQQNRFASMIPLDYDRAREDEVTLFLRVLKLDLEISQRRLTVAIAHGVTATSHTTIVPLIVIQGGDVVEGVLSGEGSQRFHAVVGTIHDDGSENSCF